MDGHEKRPQNNRVRMWVPEVTNSVHINADVNMGLSGHYHIQLIDAKTKLVKQELSFPNILTDRFMDGVGSDAFNAGGVNTRAFVYLAVGTGNTTPATTDIALVAEVARTTSNGGITDVLSSNSSPEYGYVRRTKIFTEAQANSTLREIGYFNASSGGTLMNRTLFKDSAGNPTSIVKTSEDLLVVSYEWRLTAPANDVTGTVSYLNGTESSSFVLRPQGVNIDTHWINFTQTIGDWRINTLTTDLAMFSRDTFLNTRTGLNTPTTLNGAISRIDSSSYVTGTYYRDVTYTLESGDGNYVEGISLLTPTPWYGNAAANRRYMYQMLFTPQFPKTNVRLLTITLRYSWSRI